MLILTLVTTVMLVMMTRHRIWLYAAATGAVLALSLWHLVAFFEQLLPPAWHSFTGVLAFLAMAVVLMGMISLQEKIQQKQMDSEN